MNIKKTNYRGFTICTREDKHSLDWSVVNEVIITDCYKLHSLKDKIPAPKVILDIGGHIGTFGIFAKKLFPDALLIAVEPCVANYNLYLENIKVNKLSNVHVLNKGISYNTNKTFLLDGPRATGGCLLRSEEESKKIEVNGRYKVIQTKVEVITIEDIIKQFDITKVDLIKWDCEGAEMWAFRNMQEETKNKFSYMVGEFHVLSGDYRAFQQEVTKLFPHLYFEIKGKPNFPLGKFYAYPKENK